MAGYYTIESIAHATVRKLLDVKGISEAKVHKLKEIVKQMVPMDFKTAADALEDRK
jgi:DNA repair protein RAD51